MADRKTRLPGRGMTASEVLQLMLDENLTLKDLIDQAIIDDAIIGVGLISLREALADIVNAHLK